ncbi:MAG: hypothetical protein E5W38_04300 [Mesorhizobium sp.]|nr:MAG: hypothetical protein E5W38_04300 [Mesorhizobium sp.]
MAQLLYDQASLVKWFGREVPGIALGHTLPFFAEIADTVLARLVAAGVTIIPLEKVVADPAYDEVGSTASSKFLVLQQKLAKAFTAALWRWRETDETDIAALTHEAVIVRYQASGVHH